MVDVEEMEPWGSVCGESHVRNTLFLPEQITYENFKSTCDMLNGELPTIKYARILFNISNKIPLFSRSVNNMQLSTTHLDKNKNKNKTTGTANSKQLWTKSEN